MNVYGDIAQLTTDIYEEGMDSERANRIAELLINARSMKDMATDRENQLKEIWLDCYIRGEVEKNTKFKGLDFKLECRDARPPKTVKTPGHFVANIEAMIEAYGVDTLVSAGLISWVPEAVETKKGSDASVAMFMPKGGK